MKRAINGKYLANKFFTEYSGKQLADEVQDYVNNIIFNGRDFIEEIKNREDKEKILDVLYLHIYQLKNFADIGWYDARNEYSIKTGEQIYFLLKDEIEETIIKHDFFVPVKINSNSTKESGFIIAMGGAHRTLLQTFSGLVFETLALFPEIQLKLSKLDEDFHMTPLI